MVELVGATAVLVDVDLATYNADANSFRRGLSPRTRALMPVHLFGQAADMDPILSWRARRKCWW